MRLFYGGRAFKDPPLTSIFLLVFVLVCHGVSGDETTTAVVDSTTKEAITTTLQSVFDCRKIPETTDIDDIIKKCTDSKIVGYFGKWFEFSNVPKEKIEKFLENKKSISNGIRIENNKVIDKLSIKKVESIGKIGQVDAVALYIVNTNLQTIEFYDKSTSSDPDPEDLAFDGTVVVRGNKRLDQATLSTISTASTAVGADKDIQSFGECFVPSLITDLKELDDCHYIVGDLIFANWPIGTTSNEIKLITGNVKIINTDLTKLPFSQNEKVKIDGNLEFQDNHGLCWINDENFKEYFEVKGKVRIRNTPCPYTPSAPINTTTKMRKKSKQTTTAAPAVTEEATTAKDSNNVFLVVPALSVFYLILL